MAKYTNTVEYKLKTTADLSGINQLQAQLKKLQSDFANLTINPKSAFKGNAEEVRETIEAVEKLQKVLSSSTNTSLGTIDLTKFNAQLSAAGMSMDSLRTSLGRAGVAGKQAFNNVLNTITNLDTKTKAISSTTDKMFNTIGNTVRWGVVASAFQSMSNSVYQTVQYFKDLDKSLNDIRIVTGQSASDMQSFAKYASDAAASLGKTTVDFTNASLIFAQQGYSQERSNELATLTLKTANVTGQDTAEVSEQLTSLINGFQLQNESIGTIEAQVDKLAKVAAVGGADLEELATAESKVASTANTLGVTQDQLVSQLSTIISVTRQAPRFYGRIASNCYVNCA